MSKNAITIDQIKLACRHFEEMIDAGVTENYAIRTLEHFVDVFAKRSKGGSATPHHVSQVKLWSVKAKEVRDKHPNAKPKDHFRIEHGTPRRGFARKVLGLYKENMLDEKHLSDIVGRYWKLAVITIQEDDSLNKIARSRVYPSPYERWADAGIEFD